MSEFKNGYRLRDLQYRDAGQVVRRVTANPDLAIDFPKLGQKYGNLAQALLSIRGNKHSSTVHAFAAEFRPDDATTNHRLRVVGMGSVWRAPIATLDVSLKHGVNMAGWLDQAHRGLGAGAQLAADLHREAAHLGEPWTVARPDNEPVVKILQDLGLVAVGEPTDLGELTGDGVTAERQLYVDFHGMVELGDEEDLTN